MEKSVAVLAGLLNVTADDVQGYIKEDSLGARIEDFKAKNVILSKEDHDKFKRNYASEVIQNFEKSLVDKAKKGELDSDLYKVVHGAALEKKERELAKKFDIGTFDSFTDLIDKIVQKSQSEVSKGDAGKGYEQKIKELQDANKKLQTEAHNAVQIERDKYKSMLIASKKSETVGSMPFDFEGADDVDQVSQRTKKILLSVFDTDFNVSVSDDFTGFTVSDKQGNILKDEATREPLSLPEVFTNIAKQINIKMKSADTGGHGGGSSKASGSAIPKILNKAEYNAYRESLKIKAGSAEDVDLFGKVKKANPDMDLF